jgi:hypothetical protein
VEENVVSPSRVGQRIWTGPLVPGQTVEGGVKKAFDQGRESSGIPTPPPCLATDPNDLWQDSFGKDDPAEYE